MTKYLAIALLITGFLAGDAYGEELTIKEFFKISPDDVNFDNPKRNLDSKTAKTGREKVSGSKCNR